MGQVPGITRTRPGITLQYGRIRKLVSIFATLNYTSCSETQSGLCLATIFDARHCGVTRNRYLPTWYFAGQGRWQSTAGRFNQSSDTTYSDVRIDRRSDYATRYVAFLAASTSNWPGVTARCFGYGDFYCDIIIMFRVVHYNKDFYLKIRNKNNAIKIT